MSKELFCLTLSAIHFQCTDGYGFLWDIQEGIKMRCNKCNNIMCFQCGKKVSEIKYNNIVLNKNKLLYNFFFQYIDMPCTILFIIYTMKGGRMFYHDMRVPKL